MDYYEIRIVQDGNVTQSGYGSGISACQALENAFASGDIFIPSGTEVFTAFVLNKNGLIFRFDLCTALQL